MDSLSIALSFSALPGLPGLSVGWGQFLVDLALKSVIILLGALALAGVCRQAGAAARHRIWIAAVCGLLFLPLLALALPGWRAPLLPSWQPGGQPGGQPEARSGVERGMAVAFDGMKEPGDGKEMREQTERTERSESLSSFPLISYVPLSLFRSAWQPAVLMIWLIGSLAVLARLLLGTFRVRRLARQARSMSESSWEALVRSLAARLGLRRRVVLLSSEHVSLPITCGALRSVVVLPEDAERWSPSCRRAVLLHELAHVERRDCLTQTLAQVACAIYWFNPLVWLAARRLRVERELACDDRVLEVGTKASEYAAYLVEIAGRIGGARVSPLVAGMGGTQLERRVQAILDPQAQRRELPRSGAWRLDLGAACLIVPLAVLQPWADSTAAPVLPESIGAAAPSAVNRAVHDPSGSTVAVRSGLAIAAQADGTPENKKADQPLAESEPEGGGRRDEDQSPGQGAEQKPSGQKRAEPTIDQIIQMKIHGVTQEYIESLRRLGFDELTIEQATSLKIHGITEEYVNQARPWAGADLTLDKLLSMRIHGVTVEYARRMRDLGFADLSIDRLTEMRIHGVSEAYVKAVRELGFDRPTLDELLQMRIHGVTAEYIRKMRSAGFTNASIDQLIEMRIHGIDRILLN